MRTIVAGLLALLAVPFVGCALAPPIVLDASPADLERLVGEWEGQYSGGRYGRSGSIVFTLAAGEDHAHGDVLMIPEGSERGYSRYPGMDATRQLSQVLTIRFARAHGGGVTGSMDRYWDSDAKCATDTTFAGSVNGNVMEGTFTSTCDNGLVSVTGRWKVIRRR